MVIYYSLNAFQLVPLGFANNYYSTVFFCFVLFYFWPWAMKVSVFIVPPTGILKKN